MVVAAAEEWLKRLRVERPEIIRAGYFGSYARGDYVPGSDFDVLVEVSSSAFPRWQDRAPELIPDRFPIGVNLFTFTTAELERLRTDNDPFLNEIESTIRWFA